MTSVPAPERRRGGVIYGLYATEDPSRQIRYVGKTVRSPKRRMSAHQFNARNGGQTPVSKWIRKHGGAVEMSILEECATYEKLCAREVALIAEFDTLTTSGGLNCTAGGDGSIGWVNGPEAIEKIRQKALGRSRSPESIAKAVASRAGWTPSAETRALWSEQRKGRKFTPEALERVRQTRARGEDNPRSTTTTEQALRIKEMLWDGEPFRKIQAEVGVAFGVVSAINAETTWKHIPWPSDRPRRVISASERGAVIAEETVRAIRSAYDAKEGSLTALAARFGVSRQQVWRIGRRERYAHVA